MIMLPSIKIFFALTLITVLSGCAATTPLVLAGGGNHEYLKYKTDIRLKAAAALDEEPDLITYSLNGIVENNSEDVVNTYLLGYGKDDYSQDMKSIAIYQIGLIYMNRYNRDRDDEKAKAYFHRHLIEFPYSILQDRIHDRLAIIKSRENETVQMTPEQLLAHVDRDKLLNKPINTFDPDLTPMSERAIRDNRLEDANGVYLTVYQNPGSSDSIKAKSLYQLGLIYMSEQNPEKSLKKSSYFFRKVMDEFPNQAESKKAPQTPLCLRGLRGFAINTWQLLQSREKLQKLVNLSGELHATGKVEVPTKQFPYTSVLEALILAETPNASVKVVMAASKEL